MKKNQDCQKMSNQRSATVLSSAFLDQSRSRPPYLNHDGEEPFWRRKSHIAQMRQIHAKLTGRKRIRVSSQSPSKMNNSG